MAERRSCIVLVGAAGALDECRALLEAQGHQVEVATSEGAALSLLRSVPAEVVVLAGPALTASFADSLRAAQPGRLLPLLLLGASPAALHAEAAVGSSAELMDALGRCVALRARVDALLSAATEPTPEVALSEIQTALTDELRRAHRYDDPLGLLLLELDGEALLRNRLGQSGMQALHEGFIEVITRCARTTDKQARVPPARFALVLPRTPLAGALTVAERICREVAQLPPRIVTCSIGLAMLPSGSLLTAPELWALSDQALQLAREQGGDRVCLAPPG